MTFTCPKCGMGMYCVSTETEPGYVTYKCACGYKSKPVLHPVFVMPLPVELWSEEPESEKEKKGDE